MMRCVLRTHAAVMDQRLLFGPGGLRIQLKEKDIKNQRTQMCMACLMGPRKGYIYIYMYLALVLQKKEYATKFRIPNTSDLVNIQLLHPSNLPGFAIFASLAMPYSPNISIYPLNSPRTRIQMMMTPCWGSPGQRHTAFNGGKLNTHARLKRRSLLFVGNHYVHCVFRFHLLIFQGSTSCN